MKTVGIICEYNPFHNGHLRQLRLAREAMGEDCALVCLMSGNYVQRGEPAIFPKCIRAEAAVRCGADLVLELPLTVALSSAEGFAEGGVGILSALDCDRLCYGTESEDNNLLMSTARANLDPDFDGLLRAELETGCSYAAARQRALEALGAGAGLNSPNDLLAVEYLKALLRRQCSMEPLPIRRTGNYYAETLDPAAPSAAAIRQMICSDEYCPSASSAKASPWGEGAERSEADEGNSLLANVSFWRPAVPASLYSLYAAAPVHRMQAGERAVLAILRTLSDATFASLPFGAEGLWSKLMKACRSCGSTEEILRAVKSKRYALSRIRRMLLCAVLGLTAADLEKHPPYVRILAFDPKGRALLREMKSHFPLVNAGERPAGGTELTRYFDLECRAADLYSLFSADGPRPAGEEARQRVFFLSEL